jgi:hypothetical protein
MRTILIAGLAAAGLGLASTSGASAAPVNGAVIGDLATAANAATTVQYYSYGYRYGYRPYYYSYGYRPYGYYNYGYRPYRSYGYRYGYRYY